jgi:hypothetical protein
MSRFVLCLLVALSAALSTAGQTVVGDSLAVAPVHPTSADRITFNLIIKNWDCCTQYTYDSTATFMADTQILLSYQYNLPQVCAMIACINVPKVLVYKSAPLKAGIYGVYESKSVRCTTQLCPLLAMPIMAPVRIGEVTVSRSTGIVRQTFAVSPVDRKSQNAAGEIYNARGERVNASLVSRNAARGVCFVKTSGNQGIAKGIMVR